MFLSLHLKLFINLARMLYYIVIELYDMIELLGTVSGHRCPPDSRPCQNACRGEIIFSLPNPQQQFQLIIILYETFANPKQQFHLKVNWIITLLSITANVLWPAASPLQQCPEEEWRWGDTYRKMIAVLGFDVTSLEIVAHITFMYFRQCLLLNSQKCQLRVWRNQLRWRWCKY